MIIHKQPNAIKLNHAALTNILTGAGFFASGGGGDIAMVQQLIDRICSMPNKKPIVLVSAKKVPDCKLVTL